MLTRDLNLIWYFVFLPSRLYRRLIKYSNSSNAVKILKIFVFSVFVSACFLVTFQRYDSFGVYLGSLSTSPTWTGLMLIERLRWVRGAWPLKHVRTSLCLLFQICTHPPWWNCKQLLECISQNSISRNLVVSNELTSQSSFLCPCIKWQLAWCKTDIFNCHHHHHHNMIIVSVISDRRQPQFLTMSISQSHTSKY